MRGRLSCSGRGGPADLALAQRLARRGAVQGRHADAHAGHGADGHRGAAGRGRARRQFRLGRRPGEPAGHRDKTEHRQLAQLAGPTRRPASPPARPSPTRASTIARSPPDRALEAADLLPHGSQAYAATLCWATRFAKDSRRRSTRARSIYRRYVATGPYQPWAKTLRPHLPRARLRRRARLLAQAHPAPASAIPSSRSARPRHRAADRRPASRPQALTACGSVSGSRASCVAHRA